MRTLLFLGVLFCAIPQSVFADGEGVDVLPWTTPGGQISGTVTVNPDGSATLQGQLQGVPFAGFGSPARNSDGSWDFSVILSDADTLIKKKTWIPLQLHFIGTHEDANDGDPMDDNVGSIDVRSQTGTGKGCVQLGG